MKKVRAVTASPLIISGIRYVFSGLTIASPLGLKRWIRAPAQPSAIEPKSVVSGSMSATCGGGLHPVSGLWSGVASWFRVSVRPGLLEPGPGPGADVIVREYHLHPDPDQCHGNQRLPAEPHDLVIAVAREGGPEPEEHEQEDEDLQAQPEEARCPEDRVPDARPALPGRQPAAEEEYGRQRRDQDHVGVFGQEEERERDPGVLDMEA